MIFDFRFAIDVADAEVMKWFQFSFKSEAIWLTVLSFAPAVVGLLILLLVLLLRRLG